MPIDLDPVQPDDPAPLDPPANSPAPAEELEKQADAEEAPNGVLIVKGRDDGGNITIDTVPLGNVEATEVQTLVELGLVEWRRKIGLNG